MERLGIIHGDLRKLGKNFGINEEGLEEEGNDVYDARNEKLPVGSDAEIR